MYCFSRQKNELIAFRAIDGAESKEQGMKHSMPCRRSFAGARVAPQQSRILPMLNAIPTRSRQKYRSGSTLPKNQSTWRESAMAG